MKLVVDDEHWLGIKFNLCNDGYDVVTGSNGREAVELARVPGLCRPSSWTWWSEMDGLMACAKIRAFSDVPIPDARRRQRIWISLSLGTGADDYMTKPFNILELKARVRALLRVPSRSRSRPPG